MKVVIDANVIISFLLTGGETMTRILDAWKSGACAVLVSKDIVYEMEEVIARLLYKQLIRPDDAFSMMRRLRKDTLRIATTSTITVAKDKDDNRYLTCAKDGKADYLITGDAKHLLPLKAFGKTRIVAPAEFVTIMQKRAA